MSNHARRPARRRDFWSRNLDLEAGFNLSWGAVIAGTVTFFAVFMLFSLITTAIGLGTFDPTDAQAMSGVGTGMAIWTVISILVSLFAGGFVAGLAARKTGMLHGFLTWGLSTILVFVLLTSAASSAMGAIGNAIGSITGAVGSAVQSAAGTAGDAADGALKGIEDQISIDTDQLSEESKQILRDTEVEELQPEYIQGELDAAKEDVKQAAKDLAVNPENSDQIIDDLSNSIQARIDNITKEVDRDAVKNSVAKNTDMTDAEADEAVDNAIEGVEKAQAEAEKKLEEAKVKVQNAKAEAEQMVEEGKEKADSATNKASGAAVVLFIGLLIGAALSSFAGILGSAKTKGTIVQE